MGIDDIYEHDLGLVRGLVSRREIRIKLRLRMYRFGDDVGRRLGRDKAVALLNLKHSSNPRDAFSDIRKLRLRRVCHSTQILAQRRSVIRLGRQPAAECAEPFVGRLSLDLHQLGSPTLIESIATPAENLGRSPVTWTPQRFIFRYPE